MDEFIYWEETKTLTKELIKSLEEHIGDITREELSQIEKIISKDSEYVLIHKSGLSNIMHNNIEENYNDNNYISIK
jgi:predicted nuclease of restriction endonuclease-like RecB superfamily